MEEVAQLRQLQGRYRDQGFTVLGVNVNDGDVAALATVRKKQMNYPVVLGADQADAIAERYHFDAVPRIVLIDKWGVIVLNEGGLPKDIGRQIEKLLAAQQPLGPAQLVEAK